MTDITIYISANNGEEILVLPIVPKNLPEIVQEYGHEEFETNNNVLTLIGKRRRKSLSLELLLPVNKCYRFINPKASSNGRDYIDFWEKWSNAQVPMRLVITEGVKELLNVAYTVNNLTWHYDRKKDIIAVLEISEYIFTTKEVEKDEDSYKWTDIYINNNGSIKVRAANINGHFIVPVRKVLEIIGAVVYWNGQEKQIYYSIDAVSYLLKTPFEIYDGVSFAYCYKLCDELGYRAEWSEDKNTILLIKE